MKYQSMFSKNKNLTKIIKLTSAELAQIVVKVNGPADTDHPALLHCLTRLYAADLLWVT